MEGVTASLVNTVSLVEIKAFDALRQKYQSSRTGWSNQGFGARRRIKLGQQIVAIFDSAALGILLIVPNIRML